MRRTIPLLLALAAPLATSSAATAQPADRFSYVLLDTGNNDNVMSGSSDDFRRAERYRAGRSPLLYVREDGRAYVIRDAALIQRAQRIVALQRELGDRQSKLGDQQGALGNRQAALGAEQGRLGAQMANTPVKYVASLASQQAELGRRQSELGAQQAALGARQAELGRQQARLAEQAKPQFRALVAEAVERGLAQKVD